MSKISDWCLNEGKHEGTGHYHMCHRCREGNIGGCGDYQSAGKALLIKGCSDPLRWYANMIGRIVPFLGDVGDEYKSREPAGFVNFVQYEDASILTAPWEGL